MMESQKHRYVSRRIVVMSAVFCVFAWILHLYDYPDFNLSPRGLVLAITDFLSVAPSVFAKVIVSCQPFGRIDPGVRMRPATIFEVSGPSFEWPAQFPVYSDVSYGGVSRPWDNNSVFQSFSCPCGRVSATQIYGVGCRGWGFSYDYDPSAWAALSNDWLHGPDISDVSGFYGPGTYLAWFVGCLSAIMTSVNIIAARSADNGHLNIDLEGASTRSITQLPLDRRGVDCELLGAALYPLVANVDTFYRLSQTSSLVIPNPAYSASMAASIHVAYSAAFLSLFPIFIDILRRSSRPGYNKLLTARTAIWTATYISSISAILFSLLLMPTPQNLLSLGFTTWEGLGLIAALFGVIGYDTWCSIRRHSREGERIKDKFALGVYTLLYFLVTFFGGPMPTSVTPHSEARLSDLDQGAALVFAASYVGYQWMGEIWSVLRRHRWWLDIETWLDGQCWLVRWLKGDSRSMVTHPPAGQVCQQRLSAVPSSMPQVPLGDDVRSGVQMPRLLQPVHTK